MNVSNILNMDTQFKLFHVLCTFLTIALTGWCLYKYTCDDDVSLVYFVNFNTDKQKVYPIFTACFWNPFLNDKLNNYGTGINISSYSKFLQGSHWDDRMVSIDYDDVTVSLEDHMIEMGVQFGNFSTRIWKDAFGLKGEKIGAPSFHVSNRNAGSKCFSFTMPYVQNAPVVSFFVRMDSRIFPNGKRRPYPDFDGTSNTGGGLTAFFHLPGEHLRSYFDKKYSWESRENNTNNYDMRFVVKSMEVLKRRNKLSKPCNDDWWNDGNMVMEQIMYKTGCKPPHWKLNVDLKLCSKKEDMKQFKYPTYADLQIFSPPCNVIEKLQYNYEETDSHSLEDDAVEMESNITSWFSISILFPERSYKEIIQVRAYDIESFIGDAGGYVGLFLGYSLICFPKKIAQMLKRAKARRDEGLKPMNNQKNNSDKEANVSITPIAPKPRSNEAISTITIEKENNIPINSAMKINQRQDEIESKIRDMDEKLQLVLDPYNRKSYSNHTLNEITLKKKRHYFYLSEEVFIR